MLARVTSATPWGIDACPIQVEVDVHPGLPQLQLVGLADAAIRESRERVRTAIRNCGYRLSPRAVTVSLAPADLRKEGNHLDLAIALALLAAYEEIPNAALDGRLVCGELGLDGTTRPIRGALAIADLAARMELSEVILPKANAAEAASLEAANVVGATGLSATIEHLLGRVALPRVRAEASYLPPLSPFDLSEVRGQDHAKRALEVAAAGGHNLLFMGPPGSGKTMLASRLPGILPPLGDGEALEATKVLSSLGSKTTGGLVRTRPFRAPHHTISAAGMIGGGAGVPKPGEITFAHRGVLFLDELPEFQRSVLESLRQPLEEGELLLVRSNARVRYPARFQLIASCNPCPCGHLGDDTRCDCTPEMVQRYRAKMSGPLLDRIDMHVEVPAVAIEDLRGKAIGEPSSTVLERVLAARTLQVDRLQEDRTNASLTTTEIEEHCELDGESEAMLVAAFDRLGLSARALQRVLRVSRTIADLQGRTQIERTDLAEAIQYRSLDRRTSL